MELQKKLRSRKKSMKHKPTLPGTSEDWKTLASDYQYARGGMDPDVLEAFPAQRLIEPSPRIIQKWLNLGGKMIDGQLCALKWDPIWSNVSDFGLPYGPFESGCWSDLEDIGRDDAERLELIRWNDAIQPIKIPAPDDLFAPPPELEPPHPNIGFRSGWR
jgi:hypothetical protein